jgi:exoribonuclease-2
VYLHFDIRARAREAMVEYGFEPIIPDSVLSEAEALVPAAPGENQADLTGLPWSSIDNPDTRDFDQIEFVEPIDNNRFRLRVAIADVDCYVAKSTRTDDFARDQTTSIYTGAVTFPMLPDILSADRTSLAPDRDRRAIVAESIISTSGEIEEVSVYEAAVRNRAKLDYPTMGAWFDDPAANPVDLSPVLVDQLKTQHDLSTMLRSVAVKRGSLSLETLEPTPLIEDDHVIDLVLTSRNDARDVIELYMIATNTAISRFLRDRGVPVIERVVKTPERWPKIVDIARSHGHELPYEPDAHALSLFLTKRRRADPETFPDLSLQIVKLLGRGEYSVVSPDQEQTGHFCLAVHEYTHSTAPNRRYPDLVTQRLIRCALRGEPRPYTLEELENIAKHCTEREHTANKVERLMRKIAAAVLLSDHVDETFDAIVTGASHKGTYARIKHPTAEGKVLRGERGLEVGDKIRVRLMGVDVDRGWIDFATVR